MELKNVEMNIATGLIKLNGLQKKSPIAIVISDGKAKLAELPDHGEVSIVMHQKKVKRLVKKEGVEF